jgi:hypothetical protein
MYDVLSLLFEFSIEVLNFFFSLCHYIKEWMSRDSLNEEGSVVWVYYQMPAGVNGNAPQD